MHAIYRLGLASPNVKAEAVEISEFPALAQEFRVRAVPMTVLDRRAVVTGAMREEDVVEQLVKASEASAAALGSQTTAGEATPAPEVQGPQRPPQAPGSGLILPR